MTGGPVLAVENLRVGTSDGRFEAVRGIGFAIEPGEVLAVVGESGSGKTVTGRAILGLLPPGLNVLGGTTRFEGRELPMARPSASRAPSASPICHRARATMPIVAASAWPLATI